MSRCLEQIELVSIQLFCVKLAYASYQPESHPGWSTFFDCVKLADQHDAARVVHSTFNSEIFETIARLPDDCLARVLNLIQVVRWARFVRSPCESKYSSSHLQLIDEKLGSYELFKQSLFSIVRKRHVLPNKLMITGMHRDGTYPVAFGGMADIYKGYFGAKRYALKKPRVATKDEKAAFKVMQYFSLLGTYDASPNDLNP